MKMQYTLALNLALALALPLSAASVSAQSDWTPVQSALEVTTLIALDIDYHQTLRIHEYPRAWESNPLLGKHPSSARIKTYFPIATLAQFLIADSLETPARNMFLGGLLVLEIGVTSKNRRLERGHYTVEAPAASSGTSMTFKMAF